MKDIILNTLTMSDVLRKYGFKETRGMFCCPFHGDKSPSAKSYKDGFYCFACNKGGDMFRFVQDYFKIDFKESMEKLNQDFNLGIKDFKVDINRLNKIKSEQLEKEKEKENLTKTYCELCDEKIYFEKVYWYLKSKISFKNYENIEYVLSNIKMRLWSICEELKGIDNKLSSRN